MSDQNDTSATTIAPDEPTLPAADHQVDFGTPTPGSTNPMPEERRAEYEGRIRSALDAQTAGAEKASQLFIR